MSQPSYRVLVGFNGRFIGDAGTFKHLGVRALARRRSRGFSSGLAWVTVDERQRAGGYIDKTGRLKIPLAPDVIMGARSFSEGLVPIYQPGQSAFIFIDTSGKQALPEHFVMATDFYGGLAHVKLSGARAGGGTFAYIDHTGKHVFVYHGDVPQF